MAIGTTSLVVDPRLARSLWQLGALGGIATMLAYSADAAVLPVGSALWLAVAPAVALAVAYRAVLAGTASVLVGVALVSSRYGPRRFWGRELAPAELTPRR